MPRSFHTVLKLLPSVITRLTQFLQFGLRGVEPLFELVNLLGIFDANVGGRTLSLGFELGLSGSLGFFDKSC